MDPCSEQARECEVVKSRRYKDKMEMEILGCGIRDSITAITGTLLCALYSTLGSIRKINDTRIGSTSLLVDCLFRSNHGQRLLYIVT